ncbi:branched-chain amino acid ABC transporter permease [Vulgatibacter sp.]|uniref:branched-chain amino acid ABC transporter permease n=1 Tax=Vulgatibacter sp. TaxID=1971226 RepID=UPI00356B2513
MSSGRIWLRSFVPAFVGVPLLLVASWLLPTKGDSYLVYIAGLAGINAVLAISLNIVNGFTGQFSLGHAGFMAVGGYVAAAITVTFGNKYQLSGVPTWFSDQLLFVIATLVGGLFAAVAGLLVGIPSLRLRGDYLAIVTLGFGEIIRVVIENTVFFGGATGLVGIPPTTSIFWVLFWVGVVVLVSQRLLGSSHGRALLAVREDEIAAESMGVDTTGYKVRAFAISAFFAGVAGSLLGHYLQILTPKDFTFVRSIEIVAMVVLGGIGSISGALVAALLLTILPEVLRPLQDWTGVDFRMVIYAGLLIALMLLRPQGLFGSRELFGLGRRAPAVTRKGAAS